MLFRPRRLVFLIVVTGLVFLGPGVGCNRGPKLPPLAKTTGTVTLDGKPVTSGIVAFIPDIDKGLDGPMGIGAIDSNGHYTVFTVRVEGALVGCHKLRVEHPLAAAWAVPARYADTMHSGLTAEVKADQDNVFDLPLTTKP